METTSSNSHQSVVRMSLFFILVYVYNFPLSFGILFIYNLKANFKEEYNLTA